MNDVVYRPGEWQVVVERSGVAAVPADTDVDKVVALAELLERGVPSLTEVIDVLSGGAITGLGSFAVALIGEGGTRFAVRGDVVVSTGWQESFSGADITTWSERYLPGEPRFELGFGGSTDAAAYPIRSGVVLASGVRVGARFEEPVSEADPEREAESDSQLVIAAAEPESASEPELAPEIAEPAPEPELEVSESESEAAEPEAAELAEPEPEPEAAQPEAGEPEPEPTPEPDDLPADTIAPDEVPRPAAPEDDLAATIMPSDATYAPPLPPVPSVPGPTAPAAVTAPPAPPVFASAPPAPPAFEPFADDSSAASTADIGDHDGATISLAEARRLRAASAAPDAPTEVMPVVAEPASATGARVRLSTGQVLELDRPVIIGRKPRATRASGSTLPHLVAVDSPQSDISRNHLEVRPEGDAVVVIDLHTTNGSTLLRPGSDPMRLHPGESTLVLHGDVIDLGDGVTVVIEED